MCNNKYDDDDDERWLAALSIGPGIFEIVCMLLNEKPLSECEH